MAQHVTTGAGAPGTTPPHEGAVYVDTTNDEVYQATGSSGSSDWRKMVVDSATVETVKFDYVLLKVGSDYHRVTVIDNAGIKELAVNQTAEP